MKIAFYLNIVSPHQMPLARELVKRIGADNFRYIYHEKFHEERKNLGWDDSHLPIWCLKGDEDSKELDVADVVYTGIRCFALMERRAREGKMTLYYSERWFKPLSILGLNLPGWLRVLVPSYRSMVKRFLNVLKNSKIYYLANGPWAAQDARRLGVPENKIIPWGYFVESTRELCVRVFEHCEQNKLKVLWVGRMLKLKHVDSIIKAVRILVENGEDDIELTLLGEGCEKKRLVGMASMLPIKFHGTVPIADVRKYMRSNDVLVFSSDGRDGWGAVVNEALEEGMHVLGTKETGASAAILPECDLFSAGDYHRLASLLSICMKRKQNGTLRGQGIGEWSVVRAAERFLALCET